MRLLWVGLVLAQTSVAETFTDEARNFSFEVPNGYERSDLGETVPLGIVFGRNDSSLLVMLSDQQWPQDRVIERSSAEAALRQGEENRGVHDLVFQYREVRWRSFQLEVIITRSAQQGTVRFGTWVPLASGLAVVVVEGPTLDETKLSAEFDGVIASLRSETNWKAPLTERLEVVLPATGLLLLVLRYLTRRRFTSPAL